MLPVYGKILIRVLFIVCALFLAFAVAEGVARWKLPQYKQRFLHFQDAGAWKHFTWSSVLGWRGRGHFCGHFARPEFFHEICQNSAGFRDDDHSIEKKDGKFRVLVLGDSFVYGVGVNKDELFSEIMKRNDTSLEVINTGVSGYSTDIQYLYLRDEGVLYKPDLVLVAFYLNDVWENNLTTFEDGKWQKPFFEWNGQDLTLKNVPIPNDLEKFIASSSNEERKVVKDMNPSLFLVLSNSVLANVIVDRLQDIPKAATILERVGVLYPFSLSSLDMYFNVAQSENVRIQWERTAAIFGLMKQVTDSQNIPFEVVYIPLKEQFDAEYRKKVSSQGNQIDFPQKTLSALLSKQGISFTDLSESFIASRENATSLYYRQDAHLNASGHAAFATALEKIVKKYKDTDYDPAK